ncbi:MAG: NADH-dependent [FeFe] hydrogenase, group A6 [Bacteroidia bacterium]|nr:NADH-dependent [FeFe] hydrogenase, group A6 [Bacteroidia bacterium]
MIKLIINNKEVQAEEGTTIFTAAKQNNILIPHFCYMENVHKSGSCRICVVEVDGVKNLMASCVTEIKDGMVIHTNSERVRNTRKVIYELMLSDHNKECLSCWRNSCWRNQNCELQELGNTIQIDEYRYEGVRSKDFIDDSSPSIVRDNSKCILCRRCVTICNEVQGVGLLNPHHRGFSTFIGPSEEELLGDSICANSTADVWEALYDKSKTVIVQTAPAVRAALGELFDYEPGTLVTGKMASALHEIGFNYVFDTNFAADLTIMEEGSEFLQRVKDALIPSDKMAVLPMITSCSPGWVKYVEHQYPEQLSNLSSCKSPHMMLGALAKTYFAEKIGVKPKDIYVVSVMPCTAKKSCTAKKFEILRPEMYHEGLANVDAVITTRELGRMIKDAGIDFLKLPEGKFDSPLGLSSGAADIFGTTGGVMEAALRTVYELVTGRELPSVHLHLQPLMGLEQIKTAELLIENALPDYSFLEGVTGRVAVTSGLKGAAKLMEQIKNGTSPYHFIEIMGCPGGCISGGGQPRPVNDAIRMARLNAIYREDEGKAMRKSHENEDIKTLYKEFLGVPLGHLSHELLHTGYTVRKKS